MLELTWQVQEQHVLAISLRTESGIPLAPISMGKRKSISSTSWQKNGELISLSNFRISNILFLRTKFFGLCSCRLQRISPVRGNATIQNWFKSLQRQDKTLWTWILEQDDRWRQGQGYGQSNERGKGRVNLDRGLWNGKVQPLDSCLIYGKHKIVNSFSFHTLTIVFPISSQRCHLIKNPKGQEMALGAVTHSMQCKKPEVRIWNLFILMIPKTARTEWLIFIFVNWMHCSRDWRIPHQSFKMSHNVIQDTGATPLSWQRLVSIGVWLLNPLESSISNDYQICVMKSWSQFQVYVWFWSLYLDNVGIFHSAITTSEHDPYRDHPVTGYNKLAQT